LTLTVGRVADGGAVLLGLITVSVSVGGG